MDRFLNDIDFMDKKVLYVQSPKILNINIELVTHKLIGFPIGKYNKST